MTLPISSPFNLSLSQKKGVQRAGTVKPTQGSPVHDHVFAVMEKFWLSGVGRVHEQLQ